MFQKGNSYISLKEASRMTGYASDYIGYLARSGKIRAQKIPLEVGKEGILGEAWIVHKKDILSYQKKVKRGRKPKTRRQPSIVAFPLLRRALTLVAVVAFAASWLYLSPLFATTQSFYPSSCIGNWNYSSHAQDVPDIGEEGTIAQFSEHNSAVFNSESGAYIFCGNFTGEWPEDHIVQSATLHLSLGVAFDDQESGSSAPEFEIQTEPEPESGTGSDSETSTDDESEPATESFNESSEEQEETEASETLQEEPVIEEAEEESSETEDTQEQISETESQESDTETQGDETVLQEESSDEEEAQPESESEPTPEPESESQTDSEPEPVTESQTESSGQETEQSFLHKIQIAIQQSVTRSISALTHAFVSAVWAQDDTENVEEQEVQEDIQEEEEDSAQEFSFSPDLAHISFSFDGNSWTPLGYVRADQWQNLSFQLPSLVSESDLRNLQIQIEGLSSIDTPTIYLDGMRVEVQYEEFNDERPRISVTDASFLITDGAKDFQGGKAPEFSITSQDTSLEAAATLVEEGKAHVVEDKKGKVARIVRERQRTQDRQEVTEEISENLQEETQEQDVPEESISFQESVRNFFSSIGASFGEEQEEEPVSEEVIEEEESQDGESSAENTEQEEASAQEEEIEEDTQEQTVEEQSEETSQEDQTEEELEEEQPEEQEEEASTQEEQVSLRSVSEIFSIQEARAISGTILQVQAEIIHASGWNPPYQPVVQKTVTDGQEEFRVIVTEPESSFRPGKYTLSVEVETEEAVYLSQQDFTWGVLALNVNKSIYTLQDDSAYLQMAVLDDLGDTICNASLTLRIVSPSGEEAYLYTSKGDIAYSGECHGNNVTDVPDYFAFFDLPGELGTYHMELTALTQNGEYTITDSFEVREYVPFDVERIGPTRIYPPADYDMKFVIVANENFEGVMRETVPASFEIYGEGFSTINMGQSTQVMWDVTLEEGNTYEFAYTLNTPNVSPAFYLLGPLEIGSFQESRQWQLAIDPPQILLPSADQATGSWTTTPGWSKINDDSTVNPTGDGTTFQSEGVGNNSATSFYDFQFSSGTDPGVTTGHILRVRWNHDQAGRTMQGNFELWQGIPGSGTQIAVLQVDPDVTTTENEATYTLTGTEAGNITDYGNLYGRLWGFGTGGGPARSLIVDLAEFEIPEAPSITVSGNAYNDEATTAWSECDGSTANVSLVVNGGTAATTSCDGSTGAYQFTSVSVAANNPVSVFLNTTHKGVAATVAVDDATNITLNPRRDRVWVKSETGVASIANSDLDHCDSGSPAQCSNVPYAVDGSNNLTVESGIKLIVESNKSFIPGATVTTSPSSDASSVAGDILIESGATLNVASNTLSVGGDFTNSGTFSKTSTQATTFTATATGHAIVTGSSNFHSVTFNGSTGGWSFSDASDTIEGNLTMTAGTLSGANDLTVFESLVGTNGVITMTGGTFEQRSPFHESFGTSSGSANWTFHNLTFSNSSGISSRNFSTNTGGLGTIEVAEILTIGLAGDSFSTTLDAGDRTWILSDSDGCACTPFVIDGTNGVFTANTSTFRYTGTASTNVTSTTYNNLQLQPSGGTPTYTLGTAGSQTITVNNDLTIGDGTNAGTITAATNDPILDVDNIVTINANATLTAPGTSSFTVGGDWSNSGTFTHNSGEVTLDGTSTQSLSGTMTGTSSFHDLTLTNASGADASDDERTSFVPGIDFNAAATVANNYTITTASVRVEYENATRYTFTNINWNGQAVGTRIYFRNSLTSGAWELDVSGTQTAVSNVNVSRSNASFGNTIDASDGTNHDGQNNTNWNFGATGITVSGNAYNDEATTAWTECDGSTANVSLVVNGGTAETTSCDGGTGAYQFDTVTVAANNPVSVFFNVTHKGVAVTVAVDDATNITLNPRRDRVWVKSETGVASIANSDLDHCDSGAPAQCSNVPYAVDASNNLTVESGIKLIVESNKSFIPAATVTTSPSSSAASVAGDILIESGATLNMAGNALSVGGDFTNSGTFSKTSGQTTTFTATATGHAIVTGSSNFDDVTFDGSNGGWSFSDASDTIEGNLTMTTGTLSGTNNLTVNGGGATGNGTISLTGGTFLLDAAGNFGGNTAWTFNNLTFGDGTGTATTTATGTGNITVSGTLSIAANQTLDAASKVWILESTGTPFSITGVFTANASTFRYTGEGATNITDTTYWNLQSQPAANGHTHTLGTAGSQTVTVGNDLTVGNGTNTVTLTGATNDPVLDVDGTVTISASATLTAPGTSSFTVGGDWSNSGTFTHSSGAVTFDSTSPGNTIADGGSPFHDIIFNGSGGAWLYTDGTSTAPNSTTVQNGTPTFLNTKTGTVSVTGGEFLVDWYLGIHVVERADTGVDIDTQADAVTVREANGASAVFRHNGSVWGTAAASQTTETLASGINPQPNSDGALRIREYSMTDSATCPGAGCTLYEYNLEIDWVDPYGMYDYFLDYGGNYLTSTLNSSGDLVIGVGWYRSTPSTVNGTKPYSGVNAAPTQGTWFAGLEEALSFQISTFSVDFGILEPGSNPTDSSITLTSSTSAANGYTISAWTTNQMTCSDAGLCGTAEIADWTGTNETPTSWPNGSYGFGYTTDDNDLGGAGATNRFGAGTNFAGFVHTGEGDPVADRTGTTCPCSSEQNIVTLRIAPSPIQTAGPYETIVIFIMTATY